MKIVERRAYRGPNPHALYPVVRLTVDLGELDEVFTDELTGFAERLLEIVPELASHGCCFGEEGGFVRRLEEGTLLGHVLEHVAIAVQNRALERPVSFGKTRGAGEPGRYHVVYAVRDVEAGLEVADLALEVVRAALPRDGSRGAAIPPRDLVERRLDDYVDDVRRRQLGPSTRSLVEAAEERGIPWRRLDDASLIEFGTGRFARRIQATITETTGCIATELACDKLLASRLLREAGLPVPRSEIVEDAEAAVAAAERIGYPVVLKPLRGNHGRGVRTDLAAPEDVRAAFASASRCEARVLVQSRLAGADHRLLVVDGRLVAAARRTPAHVQGDGGRTVRELVEEVNADPARSAGHDAILTEIPLDEEAERVLARQGHALDSVPPFGTRVWLQEVANLSRGGTAEDVTDRVHRDNVRLAERAARALRLDVAGVDLVLGDIARSWRDQAGGICEVNAAPGLRMHLAPTSGQARDVAGPVIDMLFPLGSPREAPIFAVTGTNGKTTTARMVAHLLRTAGASVGLATTDGVTVGDELIEAGDLTGPFGARLVLSDPRVEKAVLEVARGGILRAGVGFDSCRVAAVLNVSADHLGSRGVETVEELAYVKRVLVELATGAAVLNADDPLVAAMAEHCRRAERIVWVSRDPESSLVREHLARGGQAVILDRDLGGGERIVVASGSERRPILGVGEIPATLGGLASFNVSNALFATAMARAGGMTIEEIREGLASFASGFETTPGRLNVYDGHPFRVILDYGHNPAAHRALGELVDRIEVPGRKILAFSLPGDRRDDSIRESVREAVRHFDRFLVHDDDDRRGRARREVPEIVERVLREEGVAAEAIEIVDGGEEESTRVALTRAEPGDLLVRLAEKPGRAWRQIVHFERPALRKAVPDEEPAALAMPST